jgi:aryl-alcohol dehydrogenase-like predicted oxidoreductase
MIEDPTSSATLEQGVNHLETACVCRNNSECLGQAIAGRRDSVVLAVAYSTEPPETSKSMQQSQALIVVGERVDLMLKWKQEGKVYWCGVTMHIELF